PEVQQFIHAPDQDPGFGEIEGGYSAPRVMTTYASVPNTHWGVVVEESVDSAFAEAQQLKILAGIVLGLAVLAGLVTSYYFGRRMTKPIAQLEKGAERIAKGELDYRIDIRTGDEIELLAEEFNRMASALKESHSGLEAKIAERTRDISSLYAALAPLKPADSLEQTLDNILIRLREATGADAARVRLWDQNQRAYVCPSAIGFDGSAIGAIYPPGHLLTADQVFKSGAAAIISNIATDSRITGGNLLASGFRSTAFLPLLVGGKTMGIVQLASRTEGFFKLDKEVHLMAIARQMSVAMENRNLFAETQSNLKRIRALHEIDVAITSSLNLDEVLRVLLEQIDLFLPFPAVPSIMLLDRKAGDFEPMVCRNLDESEWQSAARKGGSQLARLVFESQHFVAIDDIQS
ncbi:MAG TPA: HAMP domain-containing protein, partial [Candidatus Binatus sp.]|nr:HAMP domain-containing protein [Candidatus Binatus sp.]